MRRTQVMTLALAAVALAAIPARAASPPQRLPGDHVRSVVLAPDGTAHVGLLGSGSPDLGFAAAAAPPGAPFGSARMRMRSSAAERITDAGVAASGEAVVVTYRVRGDHRRVRATIIAPGGVRTPLQTISVNGHTARRADLAVAPSGEAVAVWLQYDGAQFRVAAAVRAPGSARFGPPAMLSRPVGSLTLFDATIGERGDAIVAWRANGLETTPKRLGTTLHVAERPAGGAFAPGRPLAARTLSWDAELAADGTAALAIVAEGRSGGVGAPGTLRLATRASAEARLGNPVELDRGDINSQQFDSVDAAAAAGGRIGVAWAQTDGPPWRRTLTVDEGLAGGQLSRTLEIGAAGHAVESPELALASDGRAVLAWGHPIGLRPDDGLAGWRLTVAQRPAGGVFGAPEAIGDEFQGVEVGGIAPLPGEGAVIAWGGFETDIFGRDADHVFAVRV